MKTKQHVCPVWVGYIMANPLRRLWENPEKILSPYIGKGIKILEVGPAMGYFSIPMANMTGMNGKVYCLDIQEHMLKKLDKRAKRKGVTNIIKSRLANQDSLNIKDLAETIDFTFLAYVVHEVPDRKKLFTEVAEAMKKNAKILFMEPKSHVKENDWLESLRFARESGFVLGKSVSLSGNRAFELIKE